MAVSSQGWDKIMQILFCVEFYYPSVGGAQEVMRQLAERLVSYGHEVSVATTKITGRSLLHNAVKIIEFELSGNNVGGIEGNIKEYQSFLVNSDIDVIMFYAAQQWSFDAAWPVLTEIRAKKVLVPCGYSGLYNKNYAEYFSKLISILKLFDRVVYHAEDYRDINFSKKNNINNEVVIPNAADANEFSVSKDGNFRTSLSADDSTFIILTVGTITGLKGHLELVEAYSKLELNGRKSVLILNGNQFELNGKKPSIVRKLVSLINQYGWTYTAKHTLKTILLRYNLYFGRSNNVASWAQKINISQASDKKVIMVDMPREELVQAYLNADLFVFASNIEYSPLVLFEACAAGLPFLTVPVGNSNEIVKWTEGGEICEASVDGRGFTKVAPHVLAKRIEDMASSPDKLEALGKKGLEMSKAKFNWNLISKEYEKLFFELINDSVVETNKGFNDE
jgi:glycosyltransferase involved in cell wall biosynthesis